MFCMPTFMKSENFLIHIYCSSICTKVCTSFTAVSIMLITHLFPHNLSTKVTIYDPHDHPEKHTSQFSITFHIL